MAEESQSFPPISSPIEPRCSIFKRIPITIEPILFLVFFSFSISDGVSTNVLLSRTCTVVFNLPPETCNGKLNPDVEELVQPYTTKITMYRSIVEAIIAGTLGMFVGPWSDSNGRKPFLVLPTAGYTLSYIAWFMLTHLPSAHPLWFVLPSVFYTLSGGLICIFTSIFCYMTDITNEKNRPFRMAVISSTVSVGIIAGYLSSTYIAKLFPDSAASILFSIAISSSFIALLYGVFVIPESLTIKEGPVRSLFDITSVKEMIVAVFTVRPKMGRARLLLAIAVIGIGILILQGDFAYRYYALRKSFLWTLEHYNLYSAVISAISVIASTLGVYISTSVLRVHELYVALFAVLMSTLSCVLTALSRTTIEYYIFSVVGCFGNLLNPMLKAQITRNVAKSDLGKVFAFISTAEALTPLIASPLYRAVYNSVLDHMPLAVFFLSAGFWLLSAVLVIVILLLQAFCSRDYHELIVNTRFEEAAASQRDDLSNE